MLMRLSGFAREITQRRKRTLGELRCTSDQSRVKKKELSFQMLFSERDSRGFHSLKRKILSVICSDGKEMTIKQFLPEVGFEPTRE